MGDYEAVMPVFCDADRMYMPYGMMWTGVYSKKIITADICQEFMDFIDIRFKYVNITLDKYFFDNVSVDGRLSKEYI
jgi:hypothetical protein